MDHSRDIMRLDARPGSTSLYLILSAPHHPHDNKGVTVLWPPESPPSGCILRTAHPQILLLNLMEA